MIDMKIECKNLEHIYNKANPFEKVALKDVNLEINLGEFIGIIGHTGSGKSTLAQHLNGLLEPTGGDVLVDGISTKTKVKTDIRKNVGLVFQYPEYQLFEETCYKDIEFGHTAFCYIIGNERDALGLNRKNPVFMRVSGIRNLIFLH